MRWRELLDRSVEERRTLLCVGLDTDMNRLNEEERARMDAQFLVNREIIERTSKFAAAYKLNMAFYEAEGPEGMRTLKRTVEHIKTSCPDVLTILDAKKGDIGNTSKAYARSAFEHLDVDSVTLNGYMGKDAVQPFSEDPDRLCFVLCRTSNKAASEIQDIGDDEKLFLKMARIIKGWNDNGNLGMVVGATFPEELLQIRKAVGYQMPVLVPGVGAQGGDLEKVLKNGTDNEGKGILINVSRGIMFAYQKDENRGLDMGDAAELSARRYHDSIIKAMRSLGRWMD